MRGHWLRELARALTAIHDSSIDVPKTLADKPQRFENSPIVIRVSIPVIMRLDRRAGSTPAENVNGVPLECFGRSSRLRRSSLSVGNCDRLDPDRIDETPAHLALVVDLSLRGSWPGASRPGGDERSCLRDDATRALSQRDPAFVGPYRPRLRRDHVRAGDPGSSCCRRRCRANWYYTPGCSPCGGTRKKHLFVRGEQTGF